jgi:hypothetical protein
VPEGRVRGRASRTNKNRSDASCYPRPTGERVPEGRVRGRASRTNKNRSGRSVDFASSRPTFHHIGGNSPRAATGGLSLHFASREGEAPAEPLLLFYDSLSTRSGTLSLCSAPSAGSLQGLLPGAPTDPGVHVKCTRFVTFVESLSLTRLGGFAVTR